MHNAEVANFLFGIETNCDCFMGNIKQKQPNRSFRQNNNNIKIIKMFSVFCNSVTPTDPYGFGFNGIFFSSFYNKSYDHLSRIVFWYIYLYFINWNQMYQRFESVQKSVEINSRIISLLWSLSLWIPTDIRLIAFRNNFDIQFYSALKTEQMYVQRTYKRHPLYLKCWRQN